MPNKRPEVEHTLTLDAEPRVRFRVGKKWISLSLFQARAFAEDLASNAVMAEHNEAIVRHLRDRGATYQKASIEVHRIMLRIAEFKAAKN